MTRWDEAAGWYQGMVRDHDHGFNHLAADTAMDLLGVRHTRNVVDVGCGEGSFARRLAAGGATVHACGARWHAGTDALPRRQLGSYTTEGYWHTDETDSVRSIGWHHRTMATWLTTCATAGFILDELREPVGAAPERADSGGNWQHTPRLLAWRARRPNVGLPHQDGTSP